MNKAVGLFQLGGIVAFFRYNYCFAASNINRVFSSGIPTFFLLSVTERQATEKLNADISSVICYGKDGYQRGLWDTEVTLWPSFIFYVRFQAINEWPHEVDDVNSKFQMYGRAAIYLWDGLTLSL